MKKISIDNLSKRKRKIVESIMDSIEDDYNFGFYDNGKNTTLGNFFGRFTDDNVPMAYYYGTEKYAIRNGELFSF